jgi:hypothetical protein
VYFVTENWSNAHRENPYSLKAVKEVRQEYYYFPRSVHLVTFGKIGTGIHLERTWFIKRGPIINRHVGRVTIPRVTSYSGLDHVRNTCLYWRNEIL